MSHADVVVATGGIGMIKENVIFPSADEVWSG